MIRLGLTRVARLWKDQPQPWKAIHVAGTNGKGSTSVYLSGLLYQFGVKTGRFTSPHAVDKWDCIAIDEVPITEQVFKKAYEKILARDKADGIGATQFELLTITAFEIFTQEKVQVAVVETGMGGRDDATNILQHKLAAVITHIGLDHQKFLGDTIEEIAAVKAGIITPQYTPVIYSAANEKSVVEVIRETAQAQHSLSIDKADSLLGFPTWTHKIARGWATFRRRLRDVVTKRYNMSLAVRTFSVISDYIQIEANKLYKESPASREYYKRLLTTLKETPSLPGRLQTVDVSSIVGGQDNTALLDGAHNPQAGKLLATVLRKQYRIAPGQTVMMSSFKPIVWVVAVTKGKDVTKLFQSMFLPIDSVALVEFEPVDDMPWVEPEDSFALAEQMETMDFSLHAYEDIWTGELKSPHVGVAEVKAFGKDLEGALKWASERSVRRDPAGRSSAARINQEVLKKLAIEQQREEGKDEGREEEDEDEEEGVSLVEVGKPMPVVVAGSLYLTSQLLRLLRSKGAWTYPTPNYTQPRAKPLTDEALEQGTRKYNAKVTSKLLHLKRLETRDTWASRDPERIRRYIAGDEETIARRRPHRTPFRAGAQTGIYARAMKLGLPEIVPERTIDQYVDRWKTRRTRQVGMALGELPTGNAPARALDGSSPSPSMNDMHRVKGPGLGPGPS